MDEAKLHPSVNDGATLAAMIDMSNHNRIEWAALLGVSRMALSNYCSPERSAKFSDKFIDGRLQAIRGIGFNPEHFKDRSKPVRLSGWNPNSDEVEIAFIAAKMRKMETRMSKLEKLLKTQIA